LYIKNLCKFYAKLYSILILKKAFIELHAAVFLWGFTGVLGRLIQLNEGLLVWYRLLFTLLALCSIWVLSKRSLTISKKQATTLMGIGCIIAIHWLFFYGSIKYANVSVALVCLSSIAFFTTFLEKLILHKRLNLLEIALSLISIIGILFIFKFDIKFRIGIGLGIIASFFSALFSVYNKKYIASIGTFKVMFYEVLGGFIFISLFMPFYLSVFATHSLFPSVASAFYLIILALVCTIYAMKLNLSALKKISAFTANLTINLEPIYGIVLAFIIFNEQNEISNTFFWGFGCILFSVILQSVLIAKKMG
jgi:drug/metabolite transporter (DMT)-like permease